MFRLITGLTDTRALLTIEEVADLLQVSPGSIRTLREQGRFAPAVRIGRHLRWELKDVQDWAASQREAS